MAEGYVKIKGQANLSQINREVDKFAKKVDKVDKEAKKARVSLRNVSTALVGLGAAAGVSTAAFTSLISDTLNARLEIANLANTVGVSAPTFGALAQAAELAGKSSDALVGGLNALSAAAYDASKGNADAAAKFSELGVSVTDANGELRDTESVFKDVLAGLGSIPNEAERAAKAQKLMGESAGALRASLGELSLEGFEAAQIKAQAFTRGLSEEGLAAAAKYEAAVTKLTVVQRSFGDLLSDQAGPALNSLVDGLVMAGTFTSEVFTRSIEAAVNRTILFVEAVKSLGPVLSKAFSGDLRGAYQEMQKADAALRDLRETLDLGLIPVVDDLGPILVKAAVAADKMRQRMNGVHDATRDAGTAAQKSGQHIKSLNDEMSDFLDTFEFEEGSTAVLSPLGEDPEATIAHIDEATSAADRYLTTLRQAQQAEGLVSESDLADLQAYTLGFTAVTGVVGDLAGAFVDAALQSDNLSERQKKAALTAFRVQQAAALATAIVNTALGVTQALGSSPPPVNFINAGLVTAAGGVAIAEIATQKPPSFASGGLMPSTGGPAILHPGEGVLSAGAVDSIGGVSALDALNSRSAMGGQTVVVSWKHLRQSFAYEARDGAQRPGPLRNLRRDGRRAGQTRQPVRADYGSL